MTGLVVLLLLALGVSVVQLWRRVRKLEEALTRLAAAPDRTAPIARDHPAPPLRRPPAPVPGRSAAIGPPVSDAAPARPRVTLPGLEELVGGRLLVWVGAAALVVAAFFLVRYSIESGLIGPAARAAIAAVFAALLIAAGEGARRLPAFSDDQRVAQALAGAGVASAYGTLYLAAAVYDLVGALPAFALMLAITGIGLALSLRHGPPTAAMALVGGFLAPLVAGFDAAGLVPLLVYLALFIAALFALAGHRRWPWLAVVATVAGFAWTGFLIAAVDRGQVGAVGGFVVALAVAATLALPDRPGRRWQWLRLAPLTLGLVQLVALAPLLDFGFIAWALYGTIAAAALFLAWRDARLARAAPIALGLWLALLVIAFAQPRIADATILAAVIGTALFGGIGHWLRRRGDGWALLAVVGTAAPWMIAAIGAPALAGPGRWFALALIPLAHSLSLAWDSRSRIDRSDPELVGGSAAAMLLFVTAFGIVLPPVWLGAVAALAIAALILWATRTGDRDLARLPLIPLVVAGVAALGGLTDLAHGLFEAVTGDTMTWVHVVAPLRLLAVLAPPAVLLLAWTWRTADAAADWRTPTLWIAGSAALACAYVLLKLPLAVTTPDAFRDWGFAERAIITHSLLATGWWLARRPRTTATPSVRANAAEQSGPAAAAVTLVRMPLAAHILLGLGLARILWFDLFLLIPVLTPQWVGPLPLLNGAVLHPLIAAGWFAALPGAAARRIAMALMLVAAVGLVRQASHGPFLTGPVTLGENWGYSAAMLALATAWLWAGIVRGNADWRRGGLALLVLVTLKISILDAAALDGVLRILSFLGLGLALIGIHWLYNRLLRPLVGPSNPSP